MSEPFDSMYGTSPAMQAVFERIERLAAADLTVLILGETGTGKELVARSLHRRSARAAGPFVAVNCGALPLSLVESLLFGYDKGSFTGAAGAHIGHIEAAHGGTLFLDEIAELPLAVQSKLLRVVQDHRVQRLGGGRERLVDLRILAATHQDLEARLASGEFRRDLFHRLDQARVELPPLRQRGDDIQQIADAILARLALDWKRPVRLDAGARAALAAHDWPGNVRELENVLRRAVADTPGDVVTAEAVRCIAAAAPRTLAQCLDLATEAALRHSCRRHGGDVACIARELDVSADEVQRLAARFQVRLTSSRGGRA